MQTAQKGYNQQNVLTSAGGFSPPDNSALCSIGRAATLQSEITLEKRYQRLRLTATSEQASPDFRLLWPFGLCFLICLRSAMGLFHCSDWC